MQPNAKHSETMGSNAEASAVFFESYRRKGPQGGRPKFRGAVPGNLWGLPANFSGRARNFFRTCPQIFWGLPANVFGPARKLFWA